MSRQVGRQYLCTLYTGEQRLPVVVVEKAMNKWIRYRTERMHYHLFPSCLLVTKPRQESVRGHGRQLLCLKNLYRTRQIL